MAQREFPGFILRSSAILEGSRYSALLSSHPANGSFPNYFAVYENRKFRDEASAAAAAEKALGLVIGLDEEGAPEFEEGETGFDDDRPGSDMTTEDDDRPDGGYHDDDH